MANCPRCATPVEDGALFCPQCGYTVPQAIPAGPGVVLPPPPPPPPRFVPMVPPPPDWIPPTMRGIARHCVRCNTLISSVAVVCPVCQAPQPELGGVAAAAGPPG
ncbi:MAG: zinc ribbon domain-containing protein [Thermoplasmata archaeon]|nr:zinc ribbon domain-containing protein [Thermoplasmata archaeon]